MLGVTSVARGMSVSRTSSKTLACVSVAPEVATRSGDQVTTGHIRMRCEGVRDRLRHGGISQHADFDGRGWHIGEDGVNLGSHDGWLDSLDGGDFIVFLRRDTRDGAGAVHAVGRGALEVDFDARSGAAVRCGDYEYGGVHGLPFRPRITGTVPSVARSRLSATLSSQLPLILPMVPWRFACRRTGTRQLPPACPPTCRHGPVTLLAKLVLACALRQR